jgi:hypothetical protein
MRQSVSVFSPDGTSADITGMKRITVLSHAGGADYSTLAANLALRIICQAQCKNIAGSRIVVGL